MFSVCWKLVRLPQSMCDRESGAHLVWRPVPLCGHSRRWQLPYLGIKQDLARPLPLTGACMISTSPPPSFLLADIPSQSLTSTVSSPRRYFFLPRLLRNVAQQSQCTSAVSGMLRGMTCPQQASPLHPTVMALVTLHPILQVDCHNLPIDLLRHGAQAGDVCGQVCLVTAFA